MFKNRDYLDYFERLEKIKKEIEYAEMMQASLSEFRSEHREFAMSIDLDFKVLQTAYDFYKPSLLISSYTFSEQLVKYFIYSILNMQDEDFIENQHLAKFVEKKIPKKRFVPNIKVKDISNLFSEFIQFDEGQIIKLLKIKEFEDNYKSYDLMIENRHLFAHSGENQGYDLNTIKESFPVLELLMDEIYNINNKFEARVCLENELIQIKNLINSFFEKKTRKNGKKVKALLKVLKEHSKKSLKILKILRKESEIYIFLYDSLERILNIDGRKNYEVLLCNIEKLNL
ncbi:hypothetical protein HMPREF2134_02685 [Peptoniphilus lacrimalis DNF00528]|nr:hypothetical protein HMPREF2134_02685 [Peptoniphilus lacrimalis DNF00528]